MRLIGNWLISTSRRLRKSAWAAEGRPPTRVSACPLSQGGHFGQQPRSCVFDRQGSTQQVALAQLDGKATQDRELTVGLDALHDQPAAGHVSEVTKAHDHG